MPIIVSTGCQAADPDAGITANRCPTGAIIVIAGIITILIRCGVLAGTPLQGQAGWLGIATDGSGWSC